MKTVFLFTFFVNFILLAHASEADINNYAENLYAEIETQEFGDDTVYDVYKKFDTTMPESLQTSIIEKMLERACSRKPQKQYQIIETLISIMRYKHCIKVSPTIHLNLLKLAGYGIWVIRVDAIRMLGRLSHPAEQDRSIFMKALGDSMDEVRGTAIEAIRSQPDARTIFEKYLNNHKGDPGYRSSTNISWPYLQQIYQNM
jgi:hypothetical protein